MRTHDPALLLPVELNRHKHLRAKLLADIPDLDSDTLSDTLEGLTDLREMLAEVLRSALDDEAMLSGLALRIADMRSRHERVEERARRKRRLVLMTMVDAEIPKLTAPDLTASVRQGAPTLELIAEERIPAAYWKPQLPKLDRQGVLAALKAGVVIEGTALAPPQPQLSIRTK